LALGGACARALSMAFLLDSMLDPCSIAWPAARRAAERRTTAEASDLAPRRAQETRPDARSAALPESKSRFEPGTAFLRLLDPVLDAPVSLGSPAGCRDRTEPARSSSPGASWREDSPASSEGAFDSESEVRFGPKAAVSPLARRRSQGTELSPATPQRQGLGISRLPPPPQLPSTSPGVGPFSAAQRRDDEHQEQASPSCGSTASPSHCGAKGKSRVLLLPSAFKGRPDVILFGASGRAEQRKLSHKGALMDEGRQVYYIISGNGPKWLALTKTCERAGLCRAEDEQTEWSLLWTSQVTSELLSTMTKAQRVNHFPGSENLGRKDLLIRHLSRLQRHFGHDCKVAPTGFVLPKDARAWKKNYLNAPDTLWIWKPCNGRCGRRISILCPSSSAEEAGKAEEHSQKRGVIQQYIADPLLIEGYKFDLRIYVVVTSFDPLKVYLNTEGLVRLATAKYTPDIKTLGTRTMHLTNYSINKYSENFVPNKDKSNGDAGNADGGLPSKWSFQELRQYFIRNFLDFDGLFERIVDLIIKTLIAVEPKVRAASASNDASGGPRENLSSSCFEIYGFDVMTDRALQPWLLEVNIYPSLRTDSPLDKRIKTELIADRLTLIGLQPPPDSAFGLASRLGHQRHAASRSPFRSGAGAAVGGRFARAALGRSAEELAGMRPKAAVAAFDEAAWDIVLDAHDEELRSGGLRRIFPSADAGKYTSYFENESFGNVVLRKWHEAGGGADLLQSQQLDRGLGAKKTTERIAPEPAPPSRLTPSLAPRPPQQVV